VSLEPSPPRITVDGVRALARLAKSAEIAPGTVDLSLPQYRVLVFLSEHDAAAASALAAPRFDATCAVAPSTAARRNILGIVLSFSSAGSTEADVVGQRSDRP